MRNCRSLFLSFVSCHHSQSICAKVPPIITSTLSQELANQSWEIDWAAFRWRACLVPLTIHMPYLFFIFYHHSKIPPVILQSISQEFPATAKYLSRSRALICSDFGKSICQIMVIVNCSFVVIIQVIRKDIFLQNVNSLNWKVDDQIAVASTPGL